MGIVIRNNYFWSRKISDKLRKPIHWHKAVALFTFLAEAANIGIVLEIVARWLPGFAVLAASGAIAQLMLISDPLIYFFRALIRVTRLVGRTFFKVSFEEEKYATPSECKEHTIGDLVSLSLFSLSIAFFLGAIAPPIGITLAWTIGLSGLSVAGYFDYYLPEQRSKSYFEKCSQNKFTNSNKLAELKQEYLEKRNSKQLFMALLLGLSLLLICGSAASFASPALAPVLTITSKLASIFLGSIACGRFLNWWFSSKAKTKEPTSPKTCRTISDSFTPLVKTATNDLLSYNQRLATQSSPRASPLPALTTQRKPAHNPHVFFKVIPTTQVTKTSPNEPNPFDGQDRLFL